MAASVEGNEAAAAAAAFVAGMPDAVDIAVAVAVAASAFVAVVVASASDAFVASAVVAAERLVQSNSVLLLLLLFNIALKLSSLGHSSSSRTLTTRKNWNRIYSSAFS